MIREDYFCKKEARIKCFGHLSGYWSFLSPSPRSLRGGRNAKAEKEIARLLNKKISNFNFKGNY
jgi:hypothetical protein